MFKNESLVSNSNQTYGSLYGFDMKFHPVLIAIAILVIISNTLVIVLFVTKETIRKGGKLFLLSLAISDITAGLVTIPLNIGCEVTFSLRLCVSSALLNQFLAISTIYHILAITFETYYAILRPMEHRVKVDNQKVLGIALAIWFGALVIAVAPLTWTIGFLTDVSKRPSEDFLHKMSIYEIFVISFGFVLPLTLMIFAYVRMFSKINALKSIRRRNSLSHKSSNTNKNKYKTAIVFAVLLLVFTVCWLFWFVAGLLKAVSDVRHHFPKWAVSSLTAIRYSVSFINPLLYTFFRPDIYTAFKTLFRRRSNTSRFRRDSQMITTLVREPTTGPMMYVNTQQSSSSKLLEKDTKV